jgi:hypothetical protein
MNRTAQQRILQAMGIELWVPRRARGADAPLAGAPATVGTRAQADQAATEPVQPVRGMRQALPGEARPSTARSVVVPDGASSGRPADAAEGAAPNVQFTCVHGHSTAVIADLSASGDLRLARDIVAGARWCEPGAAEDAREPQSGALAFRWPQTTRGDQRLQACQQAFASFLRGLTHRHNVRHIIIADARALALIPIEPFDGSWRTCMVGTAVVIPAPALAELQRRPEWKRALWQAMLNNG